MKNLSRKDIEKELIAVTLKLLAESGESYKRKIKLEDSLQKNLGIDSLGRSELFTRIEKSFEVRLPDTLLAQAETLGDIEKYLLESEPQRITIEPSQRIVTSHGEIATIDQRDAESLTEILLLYAEKFPDKKHVFFQDEENREHVLTYGDLLKNSLRVANGLQQLGLMEGETVAIMQPTSFNFFYVFLGTLLAGGIPVPIYPPFRMHMLEGYAKTEAKILKNAKVTILVTFDRAERLSQLLKTFVPSLQHVTTPENLIKSEILPSIFHAKLNHPAFIQYTSGSTADPKGVLLTHANLLTNIKAYGEAILANQNDVAVSWLPLYHDMGLIGMWLGSLYFGVPLILLTPFTFLNHPERWLWAIHYHRGTLSGAPNFAYELCIRKIDSSSIEGLDLSSWRMAANGAEKIYPKTLEQFAEKFAPFGFKKSALLPVYGLAESTVALTIPPINREFVIDKIDRDKFEKERLALPTQEKDALSFVCCGSPIVNHKIRIVDDEGKVLPSRNVGNLQFCGPSSMQGYYNNPKATEAIRHGNWLDSGDLAYLANNEVYITGRRKDLIIKAGRNLYPAEIEELTETIPGVRQGCVAAFGISDSKHQTEKLVIIAETKEKSSKERDNIILKIKEKISDTLNIVPDHVVLVPPHVVPKTSSGKLQRAACKKMYIEGRLYKAQIPASLQIIKLTMQSIFNTIINALTFIGKGIYTLYMAILIGVIFFPMYFYVKTAHRDAAAKAIKSSCKWLLRLGFCRIKLINKERLDEYSPVIFASNHASYIDSIFLVAILPYSTRFVIKKEIFTIPLIGACMKKLDHISVDRMDLSKGLEDTKHMESILEAGLPILIFPEGTFGYAVGLRPFRLGAFKIASQTNVPICPIAINGTRNILRNDEKLMRPNEVIITVCDVIKPHGSTWQDVTHLRDKVRAEIIKYCGEPSLDFIAPGPVAAKKI